MNDASPARSGTLDITRSEVEDFLYAEAALLDAWQLDDWLTLLSADAIYRVPSNDAPTSTPREALFMVADDARRIKERVLRLQDRNAHAEFPHSRTRRFITNVRIVERDARTLLVESNFTVWRHRRNADIRSYVGQYRHRLRLSDAGGLQIAERHAILDAMELGEMGLISFIL